MNAVIYARFSSHAQNEQSIEGQLKACYEFAKAEGHTVIEEYIDRALSGKSDKRPAFLRMIEDSKKRQFKFVIVYQLDRFARNRYDSANYKAKLNKYGVRVLSAREHITEDASGILMESVLEGMAEYFSAELSQKVRRGMELSAEKCLSTGGHQTFGYKVNADKTFSINEEQAVYVRKIYEMYAAGKTMIEIIDYLNGLHIATSSGGKYSKNSLRHILRNKKYIGIYTYCEKEIAGGMPRIISDELFYEVQAKMEKNKLARSNSRAKEEFLLTTKLFCGYCREMMTGTSGTSKNGDIHYYYICKNAKEKACHKKTVRKKWIEDYVVNKCRELLSDDNIEKIVNACIEAEKKSDTAANIRQLEKLLEENKKATDNLFTALETGRVNVDQIAPRLKEKGEEKDELERQLASEKMVSKYLAPDEIRFFLKKLQKSSPDDKKSRKALITVFVNEIYLYDDKVMFILNAGAQSVTITEELLDNIEEATDCSTVNNVGVP